MDNQTNENKKICQRFFEELHNQNNPDIINDLVSPDVYSHDPFPGQKPGAIGLKETTELFRKAFPDLQVKINDMIAEDNKVMSKLTVTGTHMGEFMGFAPTHNEISYEEVIVLRLENGKIVEHWAVADALSLMQQLGAIPK
jgi:steroid delta-isomerase-like uncharacterized protein